MVTLRSSTPVVDSWLHSYGLQKKSCKSALPQATNAQTQIMYNSTSQPSEAMGNAGLWQKCSPKHLLMGTAGMSSRPRPSQQGYGSAASCKSVHRTLAPGNSKDNSTPESRPSYGKYRTRAKVFNRTFTPKNSQYSAIQSSLRREIEGQERESQGL